MNNLSFQSTTSSFQEWTNFMTDLNNKKDATQPFLSKAKSSDQFIDNLEKDLSRPEKSSVKLVLMKKQLSFDFPIAA